MNERDDMDLDSGQRKVQETLRRVAPVRPDPAFRSRLREQFMSGAIAEGQDLPDAIEVPTIRSAPASRPRSWWWTALPIAAVLIVSFLVADRGPAWRLHAVEGSGEVTMDGTQIVAGGDMRFGDEVAMSTGDDTGLQIASEGILLLDIAPHSEVVLPRAPRRLLRRTMTARVNSGELRVKSGPGFSGRRLVVETDEGRTVVIGTTISVYKGADFTCVCVLEGIARIGRDQDHLDAIPAGMRKVMFADGRAPLVTEIEPHHKADLELFEQSAGQAPW